MMIKKVSLLLLIVMFIFTAVSCGNNTIDEEALWDNAVYTEDKDFGTGNMTIYVKVDVNQKVINFTVNTDKETLRDALEEYELISGEESTYGMYVKKVNGIVADYDKTQSFWAITKDGEAVLTGVDQIEISNGEHYEFTYTKQ